MPKGYDSDGNRLGGGKGKAPRNYNLDIGGEFDVTILKDFDFYTLYELILQEGGALRLGLSLDKGALAIGIYGLGDTQTKYVRTREEFEALMQLVYRAFKGQLE